MNYKKGRKILTLLTFGCPSNNELQCCRGIRQAIIACKEIKTANLQKYHIFLQKMLSKNTYTYSQRIHGFCLDVTTSSFVPQVLSIQADEITNAVTAGL